MTRTIKPAALRLGRLAAVVALVAAGCQAPQQSGGTINLVINPGFKTAAQTGHVNHYVARLYNTGSSTEAYSFPITFAGSSRTVRFDNVTPGTYKAVVEAFGSAGETFNLSDPATTQSTTNATVSYTGIQNTQTLTVNLKLLDDGHLAPNDAGSPVQSHLYQLTRNAVASDFVWIPRYTAYMLAAPASCGSLSRFSTADNARPAGYWVGSQPSAGQRGVHWYDTTLGGFYVAKYEACREDATSGSAGAANTLAVKQGGVPWQSADWFTANLTCRSYFPGCRLMGDDEWGSLAIWSQINNLTVRGNTNNNSTTPNDFEGGGTAHLPVSGGAGLARTGTGDPSTSHDGTSNGVFDLKGNLAEWTANVASDSANWRYDDVLQPFGMPLSSNRINGLAGGNRQLAASGLAAGVDGTGKAEFGFDGFIMAGGAGNRPVRGGHYAMADAQAGIWHMNMSNTPNTFLATIGFRPVLRF